MGGQGPNAERRKRRTAYRNVDLARDMEGLISSESKAKGVSICSALIGFVIYLDAIEGNMLSRIRREAEKCFWIPGQQLRVFTSVTGNDGGQGSQARVLNYLSC